MKNDEKYPHFNKRQAPNKRRVQTETPSLRGLQSWPIG